MPASFATISRMTYSQNPRHDRINLTQQMACRNALFQVKQLEQLALIDRLATHHDRPPSLKASGNRNHDSPIFTRPFSTGSTRTGHAEAFTQLAYGNH
jgi:hypothetical protein